MKRSKWKLWQNVLCWFSLVTRIRTDNIDKRACYVHAPKNTDEKWVHETNKYKKERPVLLFVPTCRSNFITLISRFRQARTIRWTFAKRKPQRWLLRIFAINIVRIHSALHQWNLNSNPRIIKKKKKKNRMFPRLCRCQALIDAFALQRRLKIRTKLSDERFESGDDPDN